MLKEYTLFGIRDKVAEFFDWWVYGRTKENKNQLNIFNKESEEE